jgi:hypothetical protein
MLPENREWLTERPVVYWRDFRKNKHHLSLEYRKIRRWGNEYVVSRQIANNFIKKGNTKDVLILLPPDAYFKRFGVDYIVPEPAVFYYYTGLRSVWPYSGQSGEANWILSIRKGLLELIPVTDKKQLADSIASFRKYVSGP